MLHSNLSQRRPHWLLWLFGLLAILWAGLAVSAPSPDTLTMALSNAAGSAFLAAVSLRRRIPFISGNAHAWLLRRRAPLAIGLLLAPTTMVMLGVPLTISLATVWAVVIAMLVMIA